MSTRVTGSRSFGTFRGVFVPTFLSIIGVILYLRLGFVVGSAGIVGAIAIILLAVSITFSTGLSISSITTNIRIGAGGAYSIISKTLGLEVGGSVGIPLFLAQVFSVALYIFGFTEAWSFIFPAHPKIIVLLATLVTLLVLTYISTKIAINAQILVFAVVIASLVAVFAGGGWWRNVLTVPSLALPTENFWFLFALFFPAVTGLMAGIGLSGELTDPKKQIPKGVLYALGVTTLIYLAMVFWFGYTATPEQLTTNNLIILELSAFPLVVLAGILAATFSSALTTFVAAPRLLQAMAENKLLPRSGWVAVKSKSGEPRNATLFSALIIAAALLLGSLNAVAPVLTVFFLVTYAMINLVVFVEQSLDLVSFRPTFNVPRYMPLYGALGSIAVIFLINVLVGILSLVALFVLYIYFVKRHIETKEGYVRSGLFFGISEWAARKVLALKESRQHIWKPSVLFPAVTSNNLLGHFPLVKSIVYPNGSLFVMGMNVNKPKLPEAEKLSETEIKREIALLPPLVEKFGKEGIFTSYTTIDSHDYLEGVMVGLQAVEGQFFSPNILFLPFGPSDIGKKKMTDIFDATKKANVGLVISEKDKEIGLGSQEDIHVWLPSQALKGNFYEDWTFDLSLLVAYRLQKNWSGRITLWMTVDNNKKKKEEAQAFLRRLIYEARLPPNTEAKVSTSTLHRTLKESPTGDVHILPVRDEEELEKLYRSCRTVRGTYLFVKDSKREDILA